MFFRSTPSAVSSGSCFFETHHTPTAAGVRGFSVCQKTNEPMLQDESKSKTKIDIVMKIDQLGLQHALPFWGRVLDRKAACSVSETVLPLRPQNGGPQIFIDYSSSINLGRTDCCFACFIPVLPADQKQKDYKLATHEIVWPHSVQATIASQIFTYSAPVLKPVLLSALPATPARSAEPFFMCCRAADPWDADKEVALAKSCTEKLQKAHLGMK